MKKKITLSLDAQDLELIEKIMESDLVNDVNSPEQVLLWALRVGKSMLDRITPYVLPPQPILPDTESFPFDTGGVPPQVACWVEPPFDELDLSDLERIRAQRGIPKIYVSMDESDLEWIRAQRGIPKISVSMQESDPDPSMHALLLTDFGSFEKDLNHHGSDLDVPDIGPD